MVKKSQKKQGHQKNTNPEIDLEIIHNENVFDKVQSLYE